VQVDPIEKKPFYHALPGALALSFGMLGCDFHCGYCQNWVSSQTLRDPVAGSAPQTVTPRQLVSLALRNDAQVVTSTYNEPLITSEWAVSIFKLAKQEGLVTSYVSNGNGTPEVIDYIRPWVDLYKVDLKSFRDKSYRQLGGVLQNVLDTIQMLHDKGFWVEIVTLVVPGFNDSDEELRDIAQFLAGVSRDIPWHVTAFHQDYKMRDKENTTVRHLMRAVESGRDAGLNYVYAGNLPGMVGGLENTYCPNCKSLLIERWGFEVSQNNLRDGKCPGCQTEIPGFWKTPEIRGCAPVGEAERRGPRLPRPLSPR
jgi:pyruvate formate lyase activating enzyme